MSIALVMAVLLQTVNVSGGVAVNDVPQIGIATRHARCIVRRVGVAPEAEAARTSAVNAAVRECRSYIEANFAQGRVKVGDRVVNARWWRRMQDVLDSVEQDVAAAIVTPKQYKIIWQLPDGGRVDAYDASDPLTTVRLLTVPL
ncbi:hypothetical protein [Sphingomonas sp. M1-B02]|uniref:hypothetical protein n=1 Tax=Sphingomonas sp. M1-B02 TaxID=3114300 RepID=UPI00223F7C31|nr:hypothetical protein [Sphingomonas sp. S6-11]UZK64769.1 hypothetical protein OKW87_09500 [Sphingomonas sp. S6-11]